VYYALSTLGPKLWLTQWPYALMALEARSLHLHQSCHASVCDRMSSPSIAPGAWRAARGLDAPRAGGDYARMVPL